MLFGNGSVLAKSPLVPAGIRAGPKVANRGAPNAPRSPVPGPGGWRCAGSWLDGRNPPDIVESDVRRGYPRLRFFSMSHIQAVAGQKVVITPARASREDTELF